MDNDWVELFNANGAIAARAVVSQRVNNGMVMMYHAQERSSTPRARRSPARAAASTTGHPGGLKPTHMIGGYAQFSYGFNYYGTIGTNRDEFVLVRKMRRRFDWMMKPKPSGPTRRKGERQ